uniref:L-threonate dehydrogenase n=1 Tax=Actibacterium sp. MT2.3-13A TaxID=2828332 RepID=UPI001BAA1623
GLGSMGYGMAQSLLRAGHRVFGADLDAGRVAGLVAEGGESAAVAEAAAASGILVCVVLNAAQTRAVLFGPEGWARHLAKGAVIVSCATVPPEFAREMAAEAAALGLLYLDAPISGGAAKAAQGKLSVMASGSEAAFAAAAPALDAMAEVVHRLGEAPGAGSAMKSVNQLLAGVHIAAMGEALAFALSQGLDLAQVVRVITSSAGNSWMFENRAPHVVENDYAPRSMINIWPKDLGIVREIAEGAGLPVPMAETALAQFRAAAEAGDGEIDDAAVTRVYTRAAGLKLPGEE